MVCACIKYHASLTDSWVGSRMFVLPGSSNSLQKSQTSGTAVAGSWAYPWICFSLLLLLNVAQQLPFAQVCRFLERSEFAAIQSMKLWQLLHLETGWAACLATWATRPRRLGARCWDVMFIWGCRVTGQSHSTSNLVKLQLNAYTVIQCYTCLFLCSLGE